ncbi:MAG: ACT domain-containing protein [Candidatus Methanomethylophilaceae archaeon]|nr:ACT domain-containing protein [Candidatus Methanomethylophilaceae archaeon]
MELEVLDYELTVCKLNDVADAMMSGEFFFLGRTKDEISLVCPTEDVPATTISSEDGWRAFRICGTLDFSLIGILSKLTTVLAESGIGVFAVSTYDTDYILVRDKDLEPAMKALEDEGYIFKQ